MSRFEMDEHEVADLILLIKQAEAKGLDLMPREVAIVRRLDEWSAENARARANISNVGN